MRNQTRSTRGAVTALAVLSGLFLAFSPAQSRAQFDVELDEFFIRIEMNASDGDVGLHTKLDGDGWGEMEIENPGGDPIYELEALNELLDQGQTESFSESAEPLCFDAGEGEPFQTLAEFLDRFAEGEYEAEGETVEGESIGATYLLLHDIPGAPDISATDEGEFEIEEGDDDVVTIRWEIGDDFGECSEGEGADDGGLDPTDEVDLWEVTVEPGDDDEVENAGLPFTVFTVQLSPDSRSVDVPNQYLLPYLEAGIEDFKFEVGARHDENQTFSEGEFTVELEDDDEEEDDDDEEEEPRKIGRKRDLDDHPNKIQRKRDL